MKTNSRQSILDSVRNATKADRSRYEDVPRNYIRTGTLDSQDRIHLMRERLLEYGAEVVECAPPDLPHIIVRQLQHSGRHHFVAPKKKPADWLKNGVTWRIDDILCLDEIDQFGGVVTAASAAVADSKTNVLRH